MRFLGSLAVFGVALLASSAMASPITLDFEGISNAAQVGGYYNNAANDYASFSSNALVATAGEFGNVPSGQGVMYLFQAGGSSGDQTSAFLSVGTGFTGAFSFYFTSLTSVTVDFYSGAGGSGDRLGEFSYAAPDQGGCAVALCSWSFADIDLGAGIAKSVKFTGGAAQAFFDNVSFNPAGNSGGNVPEPTSLALVGLSLLALSASRRRQVD